MGDPHVRSGPRPPGAWPRFARLLVRGVFSLLFKPRLVGVPPASGPYLLIAQHQGWSDAFLILALFPASPRIRFIGERRATHATWWKRLVLRSLGVVVPVERGGGSERGAVETALALLARGEVVVLFPEGRVSRVEAQLAPFQRGVGYLAMKAGVPVLPVWLAGTAELYLGRELTAYVGDLVPVRAGAPTKEATTAFAAELHDALARILRPWHEPVGVRKRWRWLTNVL